MSVKWIALAANMFSAMQRTRQHLLRLAATQPAAVDRHVDLLLAQMMETGKDAMQDQFLAAINKAADAEDPPAEEVPPGVAAKG